jgi:hypothetical protein
VSHHQLDASGANAFIGQRQNSGFSGINRVRTITVDLNGDGRQEVVVAGVLTASPGVVQVRVLRPAATPTENELAGTYSWNSGASGFFDLDIAAGDLDGSRDGKQELVIVGRRQGSGLTAIALSGATDGTIAQASNAVLARWDQPAAQISGSANPRVAVGDLLLEGRDQVLVLTTRGGSSLPELGYNLLRFEDVDNPATPDIRFNAAPLSSETITNPGSGVAMQKLTLHIADVGGTPQREIVIHDQRSINGAVFTTVQRVRYFNVTRAQPDSGPITAFTLAPTAGSLDFSVQTQNSTFGASVGNFDRTPGDELAISYQASNGQVRTEVRKVEFTGTGVPSAIAAAPFAQIDVPATNQPLFDNMDAMAGDRDGDSLFEHYLVLRDAATGGGSNATKLWRFGFARPSPVANPVNPATFARTAAFEFATSLPETTELQVRTADWNNDSVLARIGANCRRVREPQVRSVVAMPPYWMRLQGGLDGFGASIGRSVTAGAGAGSQYDTFSSHDISAYVGLQVGGEILGIGASVTAKATAGYNYQTTRSTFSETTFETTATQSQFSDSVDGDGLVVVELNTYDCYDFEVLRNGLVVTDSDFRACELIRSENGVNLRSLQSTDLLTWDTVTAAGAGSRPAQWFPLHQDWANIALFRPVSANVGTQLQQANVTDGRFGTTLTLGGASATPFVQIDLGDVRDITGIRIWPQAGQAAALRGFNLYTSETAFTGPTVPSGAGVRTFQPDPLSGNGVDSWAVWTRDAVAGAAPMRARYIRLQHPGSATLRVAEIQVFGEVHKEPPSYPVEVCDPTVNDGLFNAVVANTVASPAEYRVIDIRGDLMWTSIPLPTGTSPLGCPGNANAVPEGTIWDSTTIGATAGAGAEWNLENRNNAFFQNATSISNSYRVGAELDLEAGAVAQVVAGGAYEYTQGVTRTDTTSMYWGTGMQYGGRAVNWASGVGQGCEYAPRPYSYQVTESANSGYGHKFTVVDYMVRPSSATWSPIGPNFPPAACFPPRADLVFGSSFEP